MSHYRLCPGGYSGVTKNASKNNVAGMAEMTIINFYKSLGLRTAMGEIEFVKHLGDNRNTKNKNKN